MRLSEEALDCGVPLDELPPIDAAFNSVAEIQANISSLIAKHEGISLDTAVKEEVNGDLEPSPTNGDSGSFTAH